MAIENHGITRLPPRKVFLDGSDDEISVSGNALVARLRQAEAPLADELVQAVRAHLDRVLRSPHFDGSARSREFLQFVVEEVLA